MADKLKYEQLEKLYNDTRRKSEVLYKCLFEECHSVMLIINPETGKILDANKAASQYYGFSKKEMMEKKILEINTLSGKQVFEEMQNAKLQKRNYFNFRHRLNSGEIRDVEVFSGPIELGKKQLLYSIIHDVSERKAIEEQIIREKNFSESLIQSLPGIMYLFDELGTFHRWNRNFEKVTEYSYHELKQINPQKLVCSEDQFKVQKSIAKVFSKGEAWVEARILTKHGTTTPFLLTGFRFVNDNQKYLVGVGIDITQRVNSENEKENLILKLQEALAQVKKLSGFLPICSSCKKIRDDEGYWNQIEAYISEHSEAEFSHGLCPDCMKKWYPDWDEE